VLNNNVEFVHDLSPIPSSETLRESLPKKVFAKQKSLDKFEIFQNDDIKDIISKIEFGSAKLSEIAKYTIGLQVYHNTMHTSEQISNRVYHSKKRLDRTYIPEITGSNINRYSISPFKEFVSLGDWNYNRPNDFFVTGKRILIREIPSKNYLNSSIIESEGVGNKAVIIVKSEEDLIIPLLTILNSRLIGFYIFNTSEKGSQNLFPRVSLTSIEIILEQEEFMKLIREDIGHSNKEISKWGISSLYINDLDTIVPERK